MTSSAHQPVTWLSLERFARVFLILLRHMQLSTYLNNRVRRLCVTMVIKQHGVLAIFTKFIIFVTKLIKNMFIFFAIYFFLNLTMPVEVMAKVYIILDHPSYICMGHRDIVL